MENDLRTQTVYTKENYNIAIKEINDSDPYFISILPDFIVLIIVIVLFPIILILLLMQFSFLSKYRGVKVQMIDPHGTIIKYKSHTFSGDFNKDAVRIRKTVDYYISIIDEKIKVNTLKKIQEKELKEKCENHFKNIVEIVKVTE